MGIPHLQNVVCDKISNDRAASEVNIQVKQININKCNFLYCSIIKMYMHTHLHTHGEYIKNIAV